ncbi:MAG TPA: protein kinase [Thermoanaerobaculia bacterium]|nr:protein kinase [Thermoanaerobaculia bacterium]
MTATTTNRRFGLSLETRIFLVTSLLIALSVGAAVAVTSVLLRRIASQAAAGSLKSSASVQATYQAERYERLKLISRLFISNPSLVAYYEEATETMDTVSLLDALSEGQKDLGFDFAILLGPRGRVAARTDNPNATGQDLSGRPLVAKALTDFEASGVWQEGDRLYYAVAVPIAKDFTVLGYLVTGFAINDLSALEVKRVSGADVAFVANGEDGPAVMATTLSPPIVRSLTAALDSSEKAMGQAMRTGKSMAREEVELEDEPWLALQEPLRDAQGEPVGATVALASLAQELAAYEQIQSVLLAAGVAAVLLAPLLAFVLTRRTLRPVRRLMAAAEAARQGDYDQKIETGRTDEVGRLAQAFSELLADLREKRDMEAYVTELSKNLPEPAQAKAVAGQPQTREVLLLGAELRSLARVMVNGDPQGVLDRVGTELERIRIAVAGQRGQIETVSGHRVLARFEGKGRGERALAAASEILGTSDGELVSEAEAPVVALAAGKAVTGPVVYGEQTDRAVVGLPVQQLESLLREATPGELLLAREVHDELRESFEAAGFRLAPRRGVISPQPLFVVSPKMAARVANARGIAEGQTATLTVAGAATLTGIAPGALMGQRFEILTVLGAGGMGVVYKARDRELDDLVALKMLKRDLWGDKGQLERLKSELKLARKITHPNVLRTFDFGEIEGVPYISMEYVRGVTLRYLLDQTKRLPYSAGLRLGKQLCAGLEAAHSVGVLHRDIKPENLILEPTGNAKLMDFGIARPVKRMTPGQTQEGFIVGTPQYIAPEVLQGKDADVRADVYSCGIVLYEIFSGALPFTGATTMDVILKHLREPPPPPSQHWPEIPPRLEAAILRCLEKDPEARYRSIVDLHHELEALSA